jgi:hypothetical protein
MYNFADSSVTASAFTSGANTALTLVATTAGLTTTAALVIYYDDQLASTTVTVSSLPAISGTVTANSLLVSPSYDQINQGINSYVGDYDTFPISGTVIISNISSLPDAGGNAVVRNFMFGYDYANEVPIAIASDGNALKISGTVTVGSALPAGTNRIGVVTVGAGTVTIGAGTAQIGSVTASISNFPATQAVSLTTLPALVAGTAQIGSVTASISGTVPVSGTFFQATQPASLASLPALAAGTNQIGSVTASISGTVPISISSVTVGNSVTIGSLPALAAGTAQIGSVTASILANPSGALTTRFGSVTTANTAQITTAVTNTSRKYLFAQNISIGSVTMGIGFSPTTTQGIQLSAGSGIVFDSFCPTGAVYWLGATTGAAWSILEG